MATNKFKGAVLAASITVIAGYGAWIGANLKTDQEVHAEVQRVKEASVEERVAEIEAMKKRLLASRHEIQRKLSEVESRITKKQAESLESKT